MEALEIGCQTCGIRFDSREAQRNHMRGDWHVYNLKRKMTALSPIPHSVFESQIINISKETSESSSSEHDDESESDDEDFTPTRCLFCPTISTSTSTNLTHMPQAHSFNIPDMSHLLDIDSFLGYLYTIISSFHECISCGSVKSSKSAVQDHMRGKGHCRLNLEEDPLELGDFWEVSEDESESDNMGEENDGKGDEKEGIPVLVEGELRLPSGKILGRRSKNRNPRLTIASLSRSRSSSPPQNIKEPQPQSQSQPPSNPQQATSSAISTVRTIRPTVRTEHRIVPKPGTQTSLIGLSDVQQRALRATEMKIEKVETKAKKMYEAKVDRKGNKQKTFRVLSIGKKAAGLEKRNG
ncbi:hypothetical protein IFR04_003354 [Cadophora malorum]|uniref:C2H2-type domain-containing protein n=1 Tax=Cadophora malorum TaxID=108018 RepID=A0A8H8BTK8_9HELO|nr:hypothetical protein IFR04_003354 [Cadophora malorum]